MTRTKRGWAAALALFCCLGGLAGCKKDGGAGVKNPTTAFEGAFTCDVAVEGEGLSCALHLEKTAEGTYQFTVQSPETLKGLGCTITVAELSFTYGGLRINPGGAPMRGTAVANVIKTLFRAQNCKVTEKKGRITVRGEDENGPYTLTFDGETLAPLEMTYGGEGERAKTRIAVENFKAVS